MELQGAKNCFDFLCRAGVAIAVFISDRHRGIAKWIRESQTGTSHYYNIWHVVRSIAKKLLKASKEKGWETIQDWIKGVQNHLYWCTTSTRQGFQEMITAKCTLMPEVLFFERRSREPAICPMICERRSRDSEAQRAKEKIKPLVTRVANLISMRFMDQISHQTGFHCGRPTAMFVFIKI